MENRKQHVTRELYIVIKEIEKNLEDAKKKFEELIKVGQEVREKNYQKVI